MELARPNFAVSSANIAAALTAARIAFDRTRSDTYCAPVFAVCAAALTGLCQLCPPWLRLAPQGNLRTDPTYMLKF